LADIPPLFNNRLCIYFNRIEYRSSVGAMLRNYSIVKNRVQYLIRGGAVITDELSLLVSS
jgi:hypothetical protein